MASAFKFMRLHPHRNIKLYFSGYNSLLKPIPFLHSKIACIHTSKKSKDPITLVDAIADRNKSPEEPISYRTPENWVSYGFCEKNISDDSTYAHLFFFLLVTCILCGYGFMIMYMPDNRMVDWVKREAHLELRRREQEGLPRVNKEYTPIESFNLPSDEELGDVEIVV